MSKTQLKITLFLLLTLAGLVVGFFFSGFINAVLTGGYGGIQQLYPAAILESLAGNPRHRMLLLCLELIIAAGIAVVMLMSRKETFESEVISITESIKTPVAVGQGQHGTARWLRKPEQRQAFALYGLDPEEKLLAELLEAVAQERKKVMDYAQDQPAQNQPDENKPVEETKTPADTDAEQTPAAAAKVSALEETPMETKQ